MSEYRLQCRTFSRQKISTFRRKRATLVLRFEQDRFSVQFDLNDRRAPRSEPGRWLGRALSALALWAVAGAACTGHINGGGGGSGTGGDGAQTTPPGVGVTTGSLCAGGGPAALAQPAPLPRLSHFQYTRALADVLKAWAPSVSAQVLAAPGVTSALSALADDSRVTGSGDKRGGFRRLDQNVQQDQVDGQFAVAQAIAAELTSSPARIAAFLGTCASDADTSNDAACVQAFIKRGGRVAQRRVLDQDDVTFYQGVYAAQGIDAAGLAQVLTTMLMSPYFTYQVEHGGQAVSGSLIALDGQELANRLSMQFWATGPDDTLAAMVDSGAILTDAGYANALDYVAKSPRFAEALGAFFREYFSVEDLDEMNHLSGTPSFDALRGSFAPTDDTRENMIDEVTRLATYYSTKPDGAFADLFTTRKSFATTDDVAQIYGVAKWSGTGDPPDMTDPDRVGLLSHAAMVASGAELTRPIIKGVVIRNVLLCDTIGQPPANAMMVAQEAQAALPPLSSTRAMTEALTETRPDCSVCHLKLINPLGFPTEMFDPLGRKRPAETVFDDAGKSLGQVPLDTKTVPTITSDDMTQVSGPADLQARLLASGKLQLCMARKYFRYTFAKIEDTSDGCTIQAIADGLTKGKPLGQVLIDLAKTPAFKQRRFN
jgi:hypothetical protein